MRGREVPSVTVAAADGESGKGAVADAEKIRYNKRAQVEKYIQRGVTFVGEHQESGQSNVMTMLYCEVNEEDIQNDVASSCLGSTALGGVCVCVCVCV